MPDESRQIISKADVGITKPAQAPARRLAKVQKPLRDRRQTADSAGIDML